jgi:HlyD family secretion protein
MPSKTRTILAVAVGAAIVGGLGYFSFRTDPVPVDLYRVMAGPMRVTIDVDGRTRIRESYDIAAPISGVAQRSAVRVGDRVVKGETVVAVVEPIAPSLLDARSRLQADAAINEATAALRVAETDLTRLLEERMHAQTHFDRTKALLDRGVATMTQMEDAAQSVTIAGAAVETAQSRIVMARSALDSAKAAFIEPGNAESAASGCCVTLTAPVDGVVLSVETISARPVAAGALLATIGDPTDIEIVADLLSSDAVRLRLGAMADVERWGGDTTLQARLTRVEPKARTSISALGIEEQRVDALFDLTSPSQERPALGDGFSVFLRVVEWQGDDVLQVPLSATFRDGQTWSVFVLEGDGVRLRPVTLGARNSQTAEVITGLDEGEMVVTHPSDDLADGVSVVPRE